MSVFDLFGREPKVKTEQNEMFGKKNNLTEDVSQKNPIKVFVPKSFEEVEEIINSLKIGKSVVVHLDEVKTEAAVRILDMLAGAVYALGGGVYEMGKNIFMFSPNGVEVNN